MSNNKRYEKTNQEPWNFKFKRRALNWFGQLLHLDKSTPARRALSSFLRPRKRPQGRSKETWLNYVRHVFRNSEANISCESIPDLAGDFEHLCADRKKWRRIVRNIKL